MPHSFTHTLLCKKLFSGLCDLFKEKAEWDGTDIKRQSDIFGSVVTCVALSKAFNFFAFLCLFLK